MFVKFKLEQFTYFRTLLILFHGRLFKERHHKPRLYGVQLSD